MYPVLEQVWFLVHLFQEFSTSKNIVHTEALFPQKIIYLNDFLYEIILHFFFLYLTTLYHLKGE